RLMRIEHRYSDALDLSTRVEACGYHHSVSAQPRRDVEHSITDLYRHVGYYENSEQLARTEVDRSRTSVATSYDRQAQAAANLAAALYDAHRFRESVEILIPWSERLAADPLICNPITRVMVFNTLGRARVILGDGSWQELFCRSEEILREWE